jgi:hypothetical protein
MRGLFKGRVVVAFDAHAVSSAVVRRGLLGARVAGVSRASLPEGALLPSAFERNLVRPDEVQQAVREAVGPASGTGSEVTLVLPHGIARVGVLDLPRGAEPTEYARFKLAASVPRFASDAIVDFLPLDGGRILAAAVRREVVAEYEEAAAAAGMAKGRVDLAPLAAASGFLRLVRGPSTPAVLVVLGDVACSLQAYEDGRLRAVRARRRDPGRGEAERLRLDALRTASAAGVPGEPELLLTGSGARGILDHLAAAGRAARLMSPVPDAGPLHEAASRPWLAAAWS